MSDWTRRAVLITGGASFIGSHLAERLVSEGARVRVADDLSSGRLNYLRAIRNDIELLRGDLRDPAFAARACRRQSAIFHLAASHGGRGYIDTHPAECASNAVLDGVVFGAAVRARVEHVTFASSACVYPVSLQRRASGPVPLLREDQADHDGGAEPDGEYGWAKWFGEIALRAQHRQHGIGAAICRLFTVYGERANETHAIPALTAKALLRLDPFPVWGTGGQRRNFTHWSDAVDGLLLAAARIEDATAVNIGADEVVTVRDLVSSVLRLTGFAPRRIAFDRRQPVGVISRAADTTRAKRLLGWAPRTPFDEGLARSVAWHREHLRLSRRRRDLEAMLTERAR